MVERKNAVQNHWTRKGVLGRIDAVLAELGHDPQRLTPEILATVEHLHTGGIATTRDQAEQLKLTPNSLVLDVGCGIGGPARYLAHTYGCRVEGIDLTPELVATGQALSERCGLADRVRLQLGDALDLPFADASFDVVWCQNVAMNIADKDRLLAGIHRVLKRGGLFTSTEYSLGPGGDIIFPVPWAYDASINFLDREDVMRTRLDAAGFHILQFINHTDTVIERSEQAKGHAPSKLSNYLVFGDDTPERQRNRLRNLLERRTIYWLTLAERL